MNMNSCIFFKIKEIELLIKKRILKMYREAGIDITPAQSKLIIYLKNNADKDIFQKDLEEFSFLSKSTLSQVLSNMETNGLITRVSNRDGRKRKIILTEKANYISSNIEKELLNIEKSLLNNIDKNKINTFLEVIENVKKNII